MPVNLQDAFARVVSEHPSRFSDATYLAAGNWGLTVSHQDGTITKLLHRKNNQQQQEWSRFELEKEVFNLQLLQSAGITGFKIPKLLSEIEELQSSDFYASYRMTKIFGNQAVWSDGQFSASEIERYFRHTGEVLGEFHQKVKNLKVEWKFTHSHERGGNIIEIPSLPVEINNALSIANDYLRDNLVGGVIHGDYHAGNILIDDKAQVTGLIDFSQTGPSINRLTDFVNLAPALRVDFIKGYEEYIQEKIDPDLIVLTDLNMWAGQATYHENDPTIYNQAVGNLYQALGKIEHITGIKVPSIS